MYTRLVYIDTVGHAVNIRKNVLPSLLPNLFLVFTVHTYAEKRFSFDKDC
jgi:hypothetical protein